MKPTLIFVVLMFAAVTESHYYRRNHYRGNHYYYRRNHYHNRGGSSFGRQYGNSPWGHGSGSRSGLSWYLRRVLFHGHRREIEMERMRQEAWNSSEHALEALGGRIPGRLFVQYNPAREEPILVSPGTIITSSDVIDPPSVSFRAEPNAYYTYLYHDVSLENDGEFVHYLKVNIKGNNMNTGDVIFCYMPSGPLRADPETGGLKFDPNDFNEYIHLIYKQDGLIDISQIEYGDCNCENLVFSRLNTLKLENLQDEPFNFYEPIAGTYMRVPSTDPDNIEYLCEFARVPNPNGGSCGQGYESGFPNVEGATVGEPVCDPANPKYLKRQFDQI